MKRIIMVLVSLVLVALMSVPVNAIYYSDLSGISMTLPSDFYEVEGGLNGVTVYRNNNGNQINFVSRSNTDKVSFVDLNEEELKDAENSSEYLFAPKDTDYTIIISPKAENVIVNGYKGVKIKSAYTSDPYIVYSTIYFFSTESNICGIVFMSTQNGSDFWYAEALKSLRIPGKIFEEDVATKIRNIAFVVFRWAAIILVILLILYGMFGIFLRILEREERRGRK